MLEKKQEIFKANYNKERGGEMKQRAYNYTGAFNVSGEKYNHYINLQADFSKYVRLREHPAKGSHKPK